jgi:hypothetical protein
MTTTTDSRPEAGSRAGSFADLIRGGASRDAIAGYLDGLSSRERVAEVRTIGHGLVGKLYDAVAGSEPLTLNDLVPEGETGTVIFEGKNSLPIPTSKGRAGRDTANNRSALDGDASGAPADARRAPPPTSCSTDAPAIPGAWPAFVANDVGLSRLVYMNMKDYCRRVAKGVLVGKAYKLGKPEGNYFTLTRP